MGWVINTTPQSFPPPLQGKTPHSRLDAPHGQSGGEWGRESLSLPPGFELRTAQLYRIEYPGPNILRIPSFFYSLSAICFHKHDRRVQHRTPCDSVILLPITSKENKKSNSREVLAQKLYIAVISQVVGHQRRISK